MPWVPSIGSGFDALAGQQQYYTGLNADVLRGNVNAVADANQQRNQYLFSLAQMQQQQAETQAAAAAKAQENQMAAYQFNANLAEQQREADQAAAIKNRQLTLGAADDTETETTRKAEAADAENLNAATDMAKKGKFASRQDLQAAIPTAPPDVINDLWDTNNTVRNSTIRSTQMAGAIANQLNMRQSFGTQLALGPPTPSSAAPSIPWYARSLLPPGVADVVNRVTPALTGANTPNPTSWFDRLKGRAAAIDQSLAKLGLKFNDENGEVVTPSNTSLQDFGITYNPKSQKYEPVNPDDIAPTASSPAWVGASAKSVATTAAPPPAAVAYLKAHPDLSAEFDEKYGAGASQSVLGQ